MKKWPFKSGSVTIGLCALSFYSCHKDPPINPLFGDYQTTYSLLEYYYTDSPAILDQHTEILSVTDSSTGTILVTTMGEKCVLTKIENEENGYAGGITDVRYFELHFFPANDSIEFTVIPVWNFTGVQQWFGKK